MPGMYPDTSPTTPVEVDHSGTLAADDQAAARPCRSDPHKLVGYARTLLDPADLRSAVVELNTLGVHSEHIYLDQVAGERGLDGLRLALRTLQPGDVLVVSRLARLARSLPHLAHLAAQVEQQGARLTVGADELTTLPHTHLLSLLTEFEVELVDQAIKDDAWETTQRTDGRGHTVRVSPVHAVQLRQLFDAGTPRRELARLFGISRATTFRVAGPPAT